MNKKSLKNFEKVLLMLVSLELIALSINLFFEPSNVAAGGATGVAILLFEGFNIPTYWSVFSINIVMLIVSYFFLEKLLP
nr:YitT family protein [Companilactobacillus versmoldensis]